MLYFKPHLRQPLPLLFLIHMIYNIGILYRLTEFIAMKKLTTLILTYATIFGLTACTAYGTNLKTKPANILKTLEFNPNDYKPITITQNGQTLSVRAYENIIYVKNPTEPKYQIMNIYIPESYFIGEAINSYTADTAPIFFPNDINDYMPTKPLTTDSKLTQDGTPRPNSVNIALLRGYVVASAGTRGCTLGVQDNYTGKALSVIVDLKSAIRYLKANDGLMAGRADRIISNGTSAGGTMSVLLGASGGSADYQTELKKAGAIMTADDGVFAASAYAPIASLESADMAYEWQFHGISDYQKMHISLFDVGTKPERINSTSTNGQKRWSDELKSNFLVYINNLNLKGRNGQPLTLDDDGNGTFKDEIVYHLNHSANTAFKQGLDLNGYDFLAQRKSTDPFYVADFNGYLQYLGRGLS